MGTRAKVKGWEIMLKYPRKCEASKKTSAVFWYTREKRDEEEEGKKDLKR